MLGDELRKARQKAGLTQEALAAKAKVSREYVSKLEHGRQSPTVEMLIRICKVLGVQAWVLLRRAEK